MRFALALLSIAIAKTLLAGPDRPPRALTLRVSDRWLSAVALSPDGQRIVSGGVDDRVRVFDSSSGKELVTFSAMSQGVTCVAYIASGERIVSGGWSGEVRVWRASDGGALLTLAGHSENITSIATSGDGKRIASGSGDDTLRIWDAESGEELLELDTGNEYDVTAVAFSPDGARVVSGDGEGVLTIWDSETGEELSTLRGHHGAVSAVAFSPRGDRIASGGFDDAIRIRDARSGKELLVLRGHDDDVTSIAFDAKGLRIASGSDDGTARVWDARSGETIATLRGHDDDVTSVALSAGGGRLVSASRGIVKIWEIATPRPNEKGPVKVFILAGQSNMEGKALASTLEPLIADEETRDRFRHLKTNGQWAVREDVWVTFLDRQARGGSPAPLHGPLSVGFGGFKMVRDEDGKRRSAPTIGPELGFGLVVGEHFEQQVLLIKAAWGGRAVKHTFRPPSAAPTNEEIEQRLAQVRKKSPTMTFEKVKASYGRDYRKIISETRRVLESIENYVPDYDPDQGYELAGFVWFQGWNDGVGKGNPDYVKQMAHFIRDVRRDLKAPGLPFVIGELGVDGAEAGGWIAKFRQQQAAIAALEEFRGNIRLAPTAAYWDTGPKWMRGKWSEFRKLARANEAKAESDPTRVDPGEFYRENWVKKYRKGLAYTSDKRYHYNGSGRSYYEMGESMGRAMVALLAGRERQ